MVINCIITTYNRPKCVSVLVLSLQKCEPPPNKIIVVDSSDEVNLYLQNLTGVKHIRSSHKNQPYQRYLGYMKSSSDILIFLDDDMEITDETFFSDVLALFKDDEVVGIGLAFVNKHTDTFLNNSPKTLLKKRNPFLKKLRFLTGYAELPIGKFGWNGVRGKQPSELGTTEWFSGGAFAVKKDKIFNNFNFQLFDLFEKKVGMGEDMLISYTLSKQGKVVYYPKVCLLHNDQKNSTYTTDFISFNKRVSFSRLFLSLEYARLNNYATMRAILIYHWYMLWRILGLFINSLIKLGNKSQIQSMKGAIQGWLMSFSFRYEKKLKRNQYWHNEALIDKKKSTEWY